MAVWNMGIKSDCPHTFVPIGIGWLGPWYNLLILWNINKSSLTALTAYLEGKSK